MTEHSCKNCIYFDGTYPYCTLVCEFIPEGFSSFDCEYFDDDEEATT